MKNAVIYARYSSYGQNEMTIESQLRICKEYAEQKGFNIVKIYNDKAKTAFKDVDDHKRKEFKQMIADAQSGVFQYIIVYMFDRFARIKVNSVKYKSELAKFGVKVLSVREPISDDEGGEIYEMFLEWNNEKYSQRLSKRVRDGLDTSVEKGTFTGGNLLYGYTKDGLKISADPEKAKVIQFLFTEYAKGTDKKEIADKLNAKGHRYNGKPFHVRSFDNWLVNEKYTGQFTFGGRSCSNMYPQIIDPLLFKKVQQRLKANQHDAGKNSAREKYYLTGKLYCRPCGVRMIADSGTNRFGVVYRYYTCKKKIKSTCHKKPENKETIELWVTTETQLYLRDSKNVAEVCDKFISFHDSMTDLRELKSLEQKIVYVQKQMEQTLETMIVATNTATKRMLDTKINDLSIEQDNLQKQYAELQLVQGVKITRKDIVEYIEQYIDGDPKDKEFQEKVIDKLVNTVYVSDDDESIIYFDLPTRKNSAKITLGETNDAVKQCSTSITHSLPPNKNTRNGRFFVLFGPFFIPIN